MSRAARFMLCVACGLAVAACARPSLLALPDPLVPAPAGETEDAPVFADEAGSLRIDQLQLKGSHNSYHRAPRFSIWPGFRYNHASLGRQMEQQGVRHLELDLRYAEGRLRVGHAPVIDDETSCADFHSCIQEIERWSSRHPLHVPVFVFVQPKDGLIGADLDDKLELLDHEVSRVFARHRLLMPRDVARGFASMREAVKAGGWPTLEATRGKVAFVLFGHSRLVAKYARGRPRLEGRVMFVAPGRSGANAEYAAILSLDDPREHELTISRAVREHVLVRTRADAHLARDLRRRDAAVLSGAHFIGTDFVDPRHAWLDLGPDVPARRNPVTADGFARRAPVLEVERRAAFARR